MHQSPASVIALDGRPASPAMARALEEIAAAADARRALEARINADSRIIWLHAQSDALWTDMAPGMDGAMQLMAEMAEGRIARRRRIGDLIRARRAKHNNFPSVVRKHLKNAAVCRQQERAFAAASLAASYQNTVSEQAA